MSESRDSILRRLRANRPQTLPPPPVYRHPRGWNRERRIGEFTERMQAVRGEVHRLGRDQWVDWINREMPARGLRRALVGSNAMGKRFAAGAAKAIELNRYDRTIESWKAQLFHDIDFGITGSLAGLAESGSLVLWPDAEEPRLLSLVPPLHIVLLEAERLCENFAQLIDIQDWADGMPTNALLISGPSKTADIEQTLAYGIHGPKALITLILE
jgi:L-lactate dehydrogenase complex protein LldG